MNSSAIRTRPTATRIMPCRLYRDDGMYRSSYYLRFENVAGQTGNPFYTGTCFIKSIPSRCGDHGVTYVVPVDQDIVETPDRNAKIVTKPSAGAPRLLCDYSTIGPTSNFQGYGCLPIGSPHIQPFRTG